MTGACDQAGDGFARIPVPQAVYDGLEAVRRSGLTNMLDRPRVAELAEDLGFPEGGRLGPGGSGAVRDCGVPRDPGGGRGRWLSTSRSRSPTPWPQIAREELGIETLQVRGRDRLDFHEVGVAGLRRALERAFEFRPGELW